MTASNFAISKLQSPRNDDSGVTSRFRRHMWLIGSTGAFLIALAWSYAGPLTADVGRRWVEDPDYSHCLLVPIFSIYYLWLRREELAGITISGSWWGLALLGVA